jgi:hypothetical protein
MAITAEMSGASYGGSLVGWNTSQFVEDSCAGVLVDLGTRKEPADDSKYWPGLAPERRNLMVG